MRLSTVSIGSLPLADFDAVLPAGIAAGVHRAERLGREELAGRRVWNVNSTARGGGVAEMLAPLLAYARGAGVDARWVVVTADGPFFAVTKRLHNRLHGIAGDGGPLGRAEIYEAGLAPNGSDLCALVDAEDIVILHDPQTAGLIPQVRARGAIAIWRCHVGLDVPNDLAREAWRFLEPYVMQADAYVLSREAFVWEELDPDRRAIIVPSIDVFSPKNQELDAGQVDAILSATGLRPPNGGAPRFRRLDGRTASVSSRAQLIEDVRWRPAIAASCRSRAGTHSRTRSA